MNSATGTDWVDDYLARIGAAAGGPGQSGAAAGGPGQSGAAAGGPGQSGTVRPVSPDLRALRDLQHAHLYSVPFENLSIHLGEPIVLDEMALVTKVVRNRRGGFCYELNGAFAALLTALGFQVSLLSARVFGDDGQPSPPFDHMALRVDLAEPWLVDVGFGRFAEQPLRMDFRGDQPDPAGMFRIADSPSGHGDLDVFGDGRPEYRMESRAYSLSDFVPTCWWQQTSPSSHFTQSLTCSILTKQGRVTLSGDRLIVTEGDERTEHTLADDAEILAAYRRYFGITLDHVPVVSQPPQPAQPSLLPQHPSLT